MQISNVVRDAVHRDFAERDSADVLRLLEAIQLGGAETPHGNDRVQLAMIILAKGSFEAFARALALAVTDWRDLLMAAGLGEDDWREVLQRTGFTVWKAAI